MWSGICQSLWARLLRPPSRLAVEHRRNFQILIRTYLFTTVAHVVFIPGFLLLGVPLLAWLNLACIGFNVCAIALHRWGWWATALFTKISAITVLIVVAGMLLGGGLGFEYYFFFVLFEVLISDLSRRKKLLLSGLLLCLALAAVNVLYGLLGHLSDDGPMREILLTLNLLNTFALFFFIILQVHFITEVTERRFRTDATHDSLTGVLNRRAILERADALWHGKVPHTLMLLDADYFKKINDTHGHSIGDEVLRHLASSLRRALRENDSIGRVGGEEFLVLLPHTSRSEALDIATRLRRQLAVDPCRLASLNLAVTMSIGLAQSEEAGGPRELIDFADRRLYLAKSSGRDQVVATGGEQLSGDLLGEGVTARLMPEPPEP